MATLPLSGITVLDFTEGMAGPTCAQHLGDFGASVIKIQSTSIASNERFLAGANRYGPDGAFGAIDIGAQRNKKRMLLNLKDSDGLRIAYQLIAGADVLLESNRPGVAERLGIGYEAVSEARPEIVYGSLSGFGQTGPERTRAATDHVLQAYAGPMSVTGEPGRPSVRIGPSTIDLLAGVHLAFGVLVALLERQDSGQGQWVDTSLYDATLAMMSRDITQYSGSGELPEKFGAWFPFSAPYGNFFAGDGEFFIGVSSSEIWLRLCREAGWEDLASDARFLTTSGRLEHRDELYEILIPEFAKRTIDEWLAMADAAGALQARVNNVAQVIAQPQAAAREMVIDIGIDSLQAAGIPIKLSRTPGQVRTAPHLPSQDTAEILGSLGYSEDEIAELRDRRAVV
jgi:crotonobetainyl-CoA:carnitine CoA-transferase CaiB-like acyl-CoA transferase